MAEIRKKAKSPTKNFKQEEEAQEEINQKKDTVDSALSKHFGTAAFVRIKEKNKLVRINEIRGKELIRLSLLLYRKRVVIANENVQKSNS